MLSKAVNWVKKAAKKVVNVAKKAVKWVVKQGKKLWNALTAAFNWVKGLLKLLFGNTLKCAISAAKKKASIIWGQFAKIVTSPVKGIEAVIHKVEAQQEVHRSHAGVLLQEGTPVVVEVRQGQGPRCCKV